MSCISWTADQYIIEYTYVLFLSNLEQLDISWRNCGPWRAHTGADFSEEWEEQGGTLNPNPFLLLWGAGEGVKWHPGKMGGGGVGLIFVFFSHYSYVF